MGAKQWALFERTGSLKKVFYALRPAMALRWLREHPAAAVAPMHLPTLLRQCDLPTELSAAVTELTDLKSRTREMGSGSVPAPVTAFITSELACAAEVFVKSGPRDLTHARAITAEFFRAEALAG